jgi:peptidoglycan L-alanyl-D-glutamate endopeptidase CwlK
MVQTITYKNHLAEKISNRFLLNSNKMSRLLIDLNPVVEKMVLMLLERCLAVHVYVLITQTKRTMDEQNALYSQGRSQPGKIVTKAKGGESYHNYGLALDFVPLDQNGHADWTDMDAFITIGNIAKEIGFEWGGDWKFTDLPHLQYTFGLTIADLKSGKEIPTNK